MLGKIIFILLAGSVCLLSQTKYPEINDEISNGNFTQAQILIEGKLTDRTLFENEKYDLKFQIEVMDRIRKDFRRTRDEILTSLKKYYPDLSDEMLLSWEKDNSLEMKVIDGEKRYFNNAVPNLFRINEDAKIHQKKLEGEKT